MASSDLKHRPVEELRAALSYVGVEATRASTCKADLAQLDSAGVVELLLHISTRDVRSALHDLSVDFTNCVEKHELVEKLVDAFASPAGRTAHNAAPHGLVSSGGGGAVTSTDVHHLPGTCVRLVDLRNAPLLNMQRASVVQFDPESCRYSVRLEYDGTIKKVRWENLEVDWASTNHAGAIIRGSETELPGILQNRGPVVNPAEVRCEKAHQQCTKLEQVIEQRQDHREMERADQQKGRLEGVDQACHEECREVGGASREMIVAETGHPHNRDQQHIREDQVEPKECKVVHMSHEQRETEQAHAASRDQQEFKEDMGEPEWKEVCQTYCQQKDTEQVHPTNREQQNSKEDDDEKREEKEEELMMGNDVDCMHREQRETQKVHPANRVQQDSKEEEPMEEALWKALLHSSAGTSEHISSSPTVLLQADLAVDQEVGTCTATLKAIGANHKQETCPATSWSMASALGIRPQSSSLFSSELRPPLLRSGPASGLATANTNSKPRRPIKVKTGFARIVRRLSSGMVPGIQKLYKENAHCDITLLCKGGTLRAHKVVLASRSKVLSDLCKNSPEIDLTDLSCPEAAQHFLDFIYDLAFEGSYAPSCWAANLDVLRLAHRFELPELKQRAAIFISRHVTTANTVECLHVCQSFGLSKLRERILAKLAEDKRAVAEFSSNAKVCAEPQLLRELLVRVCSGPEDTVAHAAETAAPRQEATPPRKRARCRASGSDVGGSSTPRSSRRKG
eukprot:TRINITY_DN102443_c0_g1_i1.p1 TRINITY_DN102443_c0_g1~~TRINITY_DN102443_c0_g1_i1.p1  ORF type:complete len:740 (+),score=132.98 TRINITY_DN102443_c0_g1_i1:139-2358(+)